jgi:hypothetical protein
MGAEQIVKILDKRSAQALNGDFGLGKMKNSFTWGWKRRFQQRKRKTQGFCIACKSWALSTSIGDGIIMVDRCCLTLNFSIWLLYRFRSLYKQNWSCVKNRYFAKSLRLGTRRFTKKSLLDLCLPVDWASGYSMEDVNEYNNSILFSGADHWLTDSGVELLYY